MLRARRFVVVACPDPGAEGTTVRDDAELMAQAADAGLASASPRPHRTRGSVRSWSVDGVVVGAGATEPPGGPHAEVVALRAAGERARGATVFATLEPCSHQGRTGPCTDALIDAGVARVVVALEDPDARVAGEGIEQLRAAGVSVDVGIGADRVARDLAPYLHHRRTGRAFAVVKTATSIDGRTAAADGTSQWITGRDREGRRARAAGRRAGGGGRGRHRARRSPDAHRSRVRSGSRAPAVAGAPRRTGSGSGGGAAVRPDARIDARPDHRRRPRRCRRAMAGRGCQGRAGCARRRTEGSISTRPSRCSAARGCSPPCSKVAPRCTPRCSGPDSSNRIVAYVGGVVLGADGLAAFAGRPARRRSPTRRAGDSSMRPLSTVTPDSRGSPPDVHGHRRGAGTGQGRRRPGRWCAHRDRRDHRRRRRDARRVDRGERLLPHRRRVGRRLVGGRRDRRDDRPNDHRHARGRRPGQPRTSGATGGSPRWSRRAGARRRGGSRRRS